MKSLMNTMLGRPALMRVIVMSLVLGSLAAMPQTASAQEWCGMDGCWYGDGNGGTGYTSDGSVEGLLLVLAMNAAILACLVMELGCFTWLVW